MKYLDADTDWTMRAAGVDGSATLALWRRGILAPTARLRQPAHRRHRPRGSVTALLMRDVGDWLVPVSDDTVPLDQHLRFLDHMAAMHATLETSDDINVVSNRTRYLEPLRTRRAGGGARVPPPCPPADRRGLATARRGGPGGRGRRRPPGDRPRSPRRRPRRLSGDAGPRQLEARQPGHRPDLNTVLLDSELPGRGPRSATSPGKSG